MTSPRAVDPTPFADTLQGVLLSGLVGALIGALLTGAVTALTVLLTLQHASRLAADERLAAQKADLYAAVTRHSWLIQGDKLTPGMGGQFHQTWFELSFGVLRLETACIARNPEYGKVLGVARARWIAAVDAAVQDAAQQGVTLEQVNLAAMNRQLTELQSVILVDLDRSDRRLLRKALEDGGPDAAYDALLNKSKNADGKQVMPPPGNHGGSATG